MEASSEKTILKFTSAAATVAACILPTVAIGILTTATTTTQKLLYIGGFTALFAIGLMYLTDETARVQIFTATAAYVVPLPVNHGRAPNPANRRAPADSRPCWSSLSRISSFNAGDCIVLGKCFFWG